MRLLSFLTMLIASITLVTTHGNAYRPIIDAGHGGFDGGAIASNGVIESSLNLEIALRTDMLFRFLGVNPVVTRRTDTALGDPNAKGRSAKSADLKRRVEICDSTDNGFIISIHQNNFSDSRYSGMHAFFSKEEAKPLAAAIQQTIREQVDTHNNREVKTVPSGVYLFKKTTRPAVLIECGFLSNPAELERLQTPQYQKKLVCVIVGEFMRFNGTVAE